MLEEVQHGKGKRVLFLLLALVIDLPLLVLGQDVDSQADRLVAELGLEQRSSLARALLIVADQIGQDVEDYRKDELGLPCTDVLRRHELEQ